MYLTLGKLFTDWLKTGDLEDARLCTSLQYPLHVLLLLNYRKKFNLVQHLVASPCHIQFAAGHDHRQCSHHSLH